MPPKVLPEALSRSFEDAVFAGVDGFPLVDWVFNRPTEPQPIDEALRIQGLAALWAEAKVSFAFWQNLPDLDWDAAFRGYLPKVIAAEDPTEYYRLLGAFVALLRDGHTYLMLPPWLQQHQVPPPIAVRMVEGIPAVVRGTVLPPGTVILAVDGRPALDRIAELAPFEHVSTEHDRLSRAARRMLLGPEGSETELEVRLPDGRVERVRLTRSGPLPAPPLLEREDLCEGRVLVRINSWADSSVVDEFNAAFPDFEGIRVLVIDQRRNGGGNSLNGNQILARLIHQPVEGEVSHVPIHMGAVSAADLHRLELVIRDRLIQPDEERPRYAGPVAVLTGIHTFSAAEDFCVLFRNSGRGPIVGEPTGGSTGNPSLIRLPGGGVGAICAKRVTYPDGSPFVGLGVQPDIPAVPTLAGLAAGRDVVLERALAALTGA